MLISLTAVLSLPFQASADPVSASSDVAPRVATTINASTGQPYIQRAWFYKPPVDGNLEPLVENFNTFILTSNDESVRDAMKALGKTGPFLQYLRMDAIQDPGSCTAQPWRNQVANQPGDFCRISQEHPDWFLLDPYGNRLQQDSGYYRMDPGNQGWREFFLERARATQETLGWDGVFLDNVQATVVQNRQANTPTLQYPDTPSFQSAVEGFLAYLSNSYFRVQNRPLYGNIVDQDTDATWYRYLNYLDGAMEEGWAVDWRSGFRTTDDWLAHLERAEQTQAQGKHMILVSQGSRADTLREDFAFASYLLVTSGNASFRYTNYNNYNEVWLSPDLLIDLGQPLGARYFDGQSWRRDFSGGSVAVNPESHAVDIQLYGQL